MKYRLPCVGTMLVVGATGCGDPVDPADTTAPAVSLEVVDWYTASPDFGIRGTARDDHGVTALSHVVDISGIPEPVAIEAGRVIDFEIKVRIPEARVQLRVDALDAAGHVGSAEIVLVYDTTPPSPTAISPLFGPSQILPAVVYAYDWVGNLPGRVNGSTAAVGDAAPSVGTLIASWDDGLRSSFLVPFQADRAQSVRFTVFDRAGNGSMIVRHFEPVDAPAISISAGGTHSCAVFNDGTARCWGDNAVGQLGDGSTAPARGPVVVADGHAWSAIAASRSHTCALDRTGRVWCWGSLDYSTLPPEHERIASPAPTPVLDSEGHIFRSITAGAGHNCAITDTQRAYCWGENVFGALGDGTTEGSARPVAVIGGHLFKAITAGSFHTCGLTTDGSAYCWGDNSYGQLGTGEAPLHPNPEPLRVPLDEELSSITAGALHTCAATIDGVGYCWGQSAWGRLGHYEWEEFVPNAMAGGTRFAAVDAGYLHSCGLDVDGRAWCWGSSHDGTLGTVLLPSWPRVQFEAVPVEAAPGLNFIELSTGGTHSCGRTAEGAVYCFGCDGSGQVNGGANGVGSVCTF